jgi:hypothetical protein
MSSEPTVVRVLVPPVLSGLNVLVRMVALSDDSIRTEVWNDGAWVPGADCSVLVSCPPALPEELRALGVPAD